MWLHGFGTRWRQKSFSKLQSTPTKKHRSSHGSKALSKRDAPVQVYFQRMLKLQEKSMDGKKDLRTKLLKAFQAYDADKNGTITPLEFKNGLAVLGYQVPLSKARALIDQGDTDGDHVLDYSEVLALIFSTPEALEELKRSMGKNDKLRSRQPEFMRYKEEIEV